MTVDYRHTHTHIYLHTLPTAYIHIYIQFANYWTDSNRIVTGSCLSVAAFVTLSCNTFVGLKKILIKGKMDTLRY